MKKNKITKFLSILALTMTLSVVAAPEVNAQCPMCRMSAESNLKNGGTDGKGLNKGILYMLATPYMLIGAIGFIWWRNRRKEGEEEEPGTAQEIVS
ncbi:MAG: hypothetical protein HRU12_23710 [Phaeodactylibacter sp.]|nr:hypothetical protein [Phaeodactylibacter sp.]